MAGEVRANYAELAQLASGVLDAADGVTDGLDAARSGFTLSASAFGDSDAGKAAHLAHEVATECVGTATERMIEVMEGDVDRLYGIAFAYQETDRRSAADMSVPLGGQLA